jgi:hypothetical protein
MVSCLFVWKRFNPWNLNRSQFHVGNCSSVTEIKTTSLEVFEVGDELRNKNRLAGVR